MCDRLSVAELSLVNSDLVVVLDRGPLLIEIVPDGGGDSVLCRGLTLALVDFDDSELAVTEPLESGDGELLLDSSSVGEILSEYRFEIVNESVREIVMVEGSFVKEYDRVRDIAPV